MSAHSTLRITRSRVKTFLLGALLDADDDKLGAWMDQILESRLYNVRIVSDDEENDDNQL